MPDGEALSGIFCIAPQLCPGALGVLEKFHLPERCPQSLALGPKLRQKSHPDAVWARATHLHYHGHCTSESATKASSLGRAQVVLTRVRQHCYTASVRLPSAPTLPTSGPITLLTSPGLPAPKLGRLESLCDIILPQRHPLTPGQKLWAPWHIATRGVNWVACSSRLFKTFPNLVKRSTISRHGRGTIGILLLLCQSRKENCGFSS